MKTLEWNNIIAKCLFNEDKRGKDVFVCLTKDDIIELGLQASEFSGASKDTVWEDFCNSIKQELNKGFAYHFKCEIQRYKNTISSAPYPCFISYMVFLALPLLDDDFSGEYGTKNYYGKLKDFLGKSNIAIGDGFSTGESCEIDECWSLLESWAKEKDIGNFKINSSINSVHHKYVNKIFSQVILRPAHRETLLPKAFARQGKPPSDINLLNKYLTNSGIELKITENDHWLIAVQLVKNEWEKWIPTGEVRRPTQKIFTYVETQPGEPLPTDNALQNPIRIEWKIKGNDIYYTANCSRKLLQTFVEKYNLQNEYVINFRTENKHLVKYINKRIDSMPKDIKWNEDEYIYVQANGNNIPISGTGMPNLEIPFLCKKEDGCYKILRGKNFYSETILAAPAGWQPHPKDQANPAKEIGKKTLYGKEFIFYEINGEYELKDFIFGSKEGANLTEKNAVFSNETIEWIAKSRIPVFSKRPDFVIIENEENTRRDAQKSEIKWRSAKDRNWRQLNEAEPDDGFVEFSVKLGDENFSYLNCFIYKGSDCRPDTLTLPFIEVYLNTKNGSLPVKAFPKGEKAFFVDSQYNEIKSKEIEDIFEYTVIAIGKQFTLIISKENCSFSLKYNLEKNREMPLCEFLSNGEKFFNRFSGEKFKISIDRTDSEVYYISPIKDTIEFKDAQILTKEFFKKRSEAEEIEEPFDYMYVPISVWKERLRVCESTACLDENGKKICDSLPTKVEILFEDFKNIIEDIYDEEVENIFVNAFLGKELPKIEKPSIELIKSELRKELAANGFEIDNYFKEDFIRIDSSHQIVKHTDEAPFFSFPLAAALIITGHVEYDLSLIKKISFNQHLVPFWFKKMLKYHLSTITMKAKGIQRRCEIIQNFN